MNKALVSEKIRQQKIHMIRKNRALVRNKLLFWDSFIFRFIYNRILKYRFSPMDVLMRYEIFSERKLIKECRR